MSLPKTYTIERRGRVLCVRNHFDEKGNYLFSFYCLFLLGSESKRRTLTLVVR